MFSVSLGQSVVSRLCLVCIDSHFRIHGSHSIQEERHSVCSWPTAGRTNKAVALSSITGHKVDVQLDRTRWRCFSLPHKVKHVCKARRNLAKNTSCVLKPFLHCFCSLRTELLSICHQNKQN